ncbi:MAG: hypothetical protein JWQ11_2835 [Rhizobacter sp.]|nr:hypothetical protein [Rhizobacter sp.]
MLMAATLAFGQPAAESESVKVAPDRRDFTTGTGIVPSGHVQLEFGATWEQGDDRRQWSIGDVSLRVPVSSRVELRLQTLSYEIQHDDRGRHVGLDDTSLGLRFLIDKSSAYELALQVDSTIPSGSHSVAERRLQPEAILATTLKLTPQTSLVLNVGGTYASSDRQRFNQVVVASSLRHDLSENFNLFGEVYNFNREDRGGSSRTRAAFGAVYFLDRSTAIDARFIRDLRNVGSVKASASVGLSRLF